MYYTVITGDIVGSSRLSPEGRTDLLGRLENAFWKVKSLTGETSLPPFAIFRGDSFQGILPGTRYGLRAALLIRGTLLSRSEEPRIDARIAIGIGPVQYLPVDDVGRGDGDAYRFSGSELERLKQDKIHLAIRTPDEDRNRELVTEAFLADALIRCWTPPQAEAMVYALGGATQIQIAQSLFISRQAVYYRLDGASNRAVQEFLKRYEEIGIELTKGEK